MCSAISVPMTTDSAWTFRSLRSGYALDSDRPEDGFCREGSAPVAAGTSRQSGLAPGISGTESQLNFRHMCGNIIEYNGVIDGLLAFAAGPLATPSSQTEPPSPAITEPSPLNTTDDPFAVPDEFTTWDPSWSAAFDNVWIPPNVAHLPVGHPHPHPKDELRRVLDEEEVESNEVEPPAEPNAEL